MKQHQFANTDVKMCRESNSFCSSDSIAASGKVNGNMVQFTSLNLQSVKAFSQVQLLTD